MRKIWGFEDLGMEGAVKEKEEERVLRKERERAEFIGRDEL